MRAADLGTAFAALAILLGTSPGGIRAEPADPSGSDVESCIRCHADPDFVSTHPRLYEYYRDWERSIHGQEGVTCFDCHGGDPEASDARVAHAEFAGVGSERSAVGFESIHETCGVCHDQIADAYRTSKHYAKLKEKEGKRHGPTCVTCHEAMDTLVLDVTSVEKACARCHDPETGIEPEVPEQARRTLNKFLSIDRFHRYVAARMAPDESATFLREVDARVAELSVLWHTFDLPRIGAETQQLLDRMRAKRDEIRERGVRQKGASSSSAPHD